MSDQDAGLCAPPAATLELADEEMVALERSCHRLPNGGAYEAASTDSIPMGGQLLRRWRRTLIEVGSSKTNSSFQRENRAGRSIRRRLFGTLLWVVEADKGEDR
jgi:hypothetical protein